MSIFQAPTFFKKIRRLLFSLHRFYSVYSACAETKSALRQHRILMKLSCYMHSGLTTMTADRTRSFDIQKLENQYWCCIEEANLQGRGQGSR
jgi:hypothetical protein